MLKIQKNQTEIDPEKIILERETSNIQIITLMQLREEELRNKQEIVEAEIILEIYQK